MTDLAKPRCNHFIELSFIAKIAVGIFVLSALGCNSKILKAEKSEEILRTDEYDKALTIKEIPPEAVRVSGEYVKLPGPEPVPSAWVGWGKVAPVREKENTATGKKSKKPSRKSKVEATSDAAPSADVSQRQPPLEDGEGFIGRRPQVDPFRPNESITLETSFFGVVAGDIAIEVRPFVEVNGHRCYHFAGTAKSTSVFAMFYAVDDWFETFVDFDTLVPYSYSLHVKETKQLRETRSIFNVDNNTASFWDKKINSEQKLEEKKESWDILPFSQNVFTAIYYLRNFVLTPGKKISFRLAHEKENLVVSAEVLRRETISTPAGDFNTVVLKPKIELNGVFRPVGDIFMWLTDDDRKFLVRMESKIKIGKIVAVAKEIEKGTP